MFCRTGYFVLHISLHQLAVKARSIHQDFQAIHDTFPEIDLFNKTCFYNTSFENLMQKSNEVFQTCITQSLPRKPRSILGVLLGDSDLINKLNENMQLAVKR